MREGGALRRAANPFPVSSVVRDSVAEELTRLEVDVPALSERFALPGGRQMTESEALAVRELQGRTMRQEIEKVLGQPNYKRYTDKMRAGLITKAIERARVEVRRRVRLDAAKGKPLAGAQ